MGKIGTAPHTSRDQGFTLVEVLVTLVIIGVMTSLVVLNLSIDSDNPDELAANDLARAATLASRRAVLEGTPQSLSATKEGWEVSAFSETGWQVVATGTYPRRMKASVQVAGIPLELEEDPLPVTIWEPTGGADAFEVALDGRNGEWTLRGGPNGDVMLEFGK